MNSYTESCVQKIILTIFGKWGRLTDALLNRHWHRVVAFSCTHIDRIFHRSQVSSDSVKAKIVAMFGSASPSMK
jgi:hypothetical protein